MVYKKYIKRNGKLYGPYVYHSKRVDGKVVSEYHGYKKEGISKKFLLPILIVGILSILVLGFFLTKSPFTGKAILGIEADYEEGTSLKGRININLQKGELIPKASKIIFENEGQSYEFDLEEIVSNELVQGDFYIEDEKITGTGEGYGTIGEKISYPEIDFILNIYIEETTKEKGSDKSREKVEEESGLEENETAEIVEPELGEIIELKEISEQEIEEEETASNQVGLKEGVSQEGASSSSSPSDEGKEVEVEKEEAAPTITGGVISRIFRSVSNFFLSLTTTGQVSLELEKEIIGTVSADKEFTYDLDEGENIELKALSVEIDGKKISDNEIQLILEENKVTVTTDYSIKEKGFGQDYIEDGGETLSIDLDQLNLVLEPGELEIKLVYGKNEILELTTNLESGEIIVEETDEIIEEINETIVETNATIKEIVQIKDIGDILTIEEKAELLITFGNVSIKTIKSELINDRIIMGYQIGNYEIEYSYDSALNDTVLDLQMEKDRIKWLKDIAKTLLEKESEAIELEEFKGDFGF